MSVPKNTTRKTRLIYRRVGNSAYIAVGKRTVIVDVEDLSVFAGWTISISTCNYVRLLGPFSEKPQRCVYLHRVLLDASVETCVDHISGDRLDNRRANLRICTHAENSRNRKCLDSARRLFKGCHYYKNQRGDKKWIARIWVNGRNLFLGCFVTPEEAALAYNEKARTEFGAFARLNVIQSHRETVSVVNL